MCKVTYFLKLLHYYYYEVPHYILVCTVRHVTEIYLYACDFILDHTVQGESSVYRYVVVSLCGYVLAAAISYTELLVGGVSTRHIRM